MKIAIFTDTYLPDINGVVTSTVLMKQKLEELGNEVWIITNYNGLVKIKIEKKDHIIRLPGLELKQLYGYKISQPIHLLFVEEIRKMNFDIIHAQQEFGVGIFANIVARMLKLPIVRTYHTAYEDYTSYFLPFNNELIDNSAKKAIEYISYVFGEDCMRLIAPSNKTKQMLKRYGISTDITVIPTGLEINRFKKENIDKKELIKISNDLKIESNKHIFIYLGRIGAEKTIDLLIKGFKKVKDRGIDFTFLIVGGGTEETNLKNLVKELDLNDNVIFTGKVDNKLVPIYYNLADCFVSASTTETQGMTYIEALASGTPLICRKDDVLEDVLLEGENGFYFEDENDFVDKITKFIELSNKQKDDFSNKAVEIANEYDASLFGKRIENVYKEVIEEFDSHFVIQKISLVNDNVILKIKSEEHEEKIYVSSDTYFDLGLRKGERLTKPILDRIKKEEKIVLAYQNCLKKLSIRDYSERDMYDYLYVNHELTYQQIDEIINKLKEKNLIDDDKFVFNHISSYESLLYSKNMMIRKLKEAGIKKELIDKYIDFEDADNELIKASKLAIKYNLLIHKKSLNVRKQTIQKKLVDNGFSYDVARKAVEKIDFSNYIIEETDTLKAQAYKYKIKYMKKYKGRELRNHVFNAMVTRGFEYENIYAVIDEMEWDDE